MLTKERIRAIAVESTKTHVVKGHEYGYYKTALHAIEKALKEAGIDIAKLPEF